MPTTELVATTGPVNEPVLNWIANDSAPSVVLSAAITRLKLAWLFLIITVRANNLSEKSSAVTDPVVVQYKVADGIWVVVTLNKTDPPSFTDPTLGTIEYVGTGVPDVSLIVTTRLVATIVPLVERVLNWIANDSGPSVVLSAAIALIKTAVLLIIVT